MVKKNLTREKLVPYFFVTPAVLVLIFLLVYPIIKVIGYSMYKGVFLSKNPTFIGLDNFIYLFTQDKTLYSTLWNTVLFTVTSVIAHMFLGFSFAILLNRAMNKIANNIFKAIFILPWIFTAPVVALNWRLILSPIGIVNYFLSLLNVVPHDWYGDPKLAMISLIITNAWRGYPFFMVSILAGIQSISKVLYEAAYVDGANSLKRHLYITIPSLKPIFLSIGMLDVIHTFRVFPIVWLTTGGGPMGVTEVLSTSIYKHAFFNMDYGMASALSVVILIIIGIFSIFYIRKQKVAI